MYWTEDSTGRILRVPLHGGESLVLATDQSLPSEIVVDDANIYWIDSDIDGAVMKLAK